VVHPHLSIHTVVELGLVGVSASLTWFQMTGAMPAASPEMAPLFNVGAIGAILAWFMFRSEPRQLAMEEAIDRNTRARMVFVMAQDHVGPAAKQQAQALLEEINDADIARRPKRK
jgi:hypothetical protein